MLTQQQRLLQEGVKKIVRQQVTNISPMEPLCLQTAGGDLIVHENKDLSTQFLINQDGTVGIGKTPEDGIKLDVGGTIQADQFLIDGVPISGGGGTLNEVPVTKVSAKDLRGKPFDLTDGDFIAPENLRSGILIEFAEQLAEAPSNRCCTLTFEMPGTFDLSRVLEDIITPPTNGVKWHHPVHLRLQVKQVDDYKIVVSIDDDTLNHIETCVLHETILALRLNGKKLSFRNKRKYINNEFEYTSTPKFEYIKNWGGIGAQPEKFINPQGIALDQDGSFVYVVDTEDNCIIKFTTDGTFEYVIGNKDGGPSFDRPRGIAVDTSGNIYVADTGNGRIQKFSSDGSFITMWDALPTGEEFGANFSPTDIAITAGEAPVLFVSDANNNRIFGYSLDGIHQISVDPNLFKGESIDHSLGLAARDHVFVANAKEGEIIKLDKTGTELVRWNVVNEEAYSKSLVDFRKGFAIALDQFENVYVYSWHKAYIQVYEPDGTLLATFGGLGVSEGQFITIEGGGIAFDTANSEIYVVDLHRVQKIRRNY